MIELLSADTPNGKKISIMLEEINYKYKLYKIDLSNGEQFKPEFVKISPFSKIPVIIDHEVNETIFESVKKTNRLVILEESWPFGNISTDITYQVQSKIFDYLDAPIEKINTADTPAPYSPVLLKEWLPNSSDVVKSIKKVLYK